MNVCLPYFDREQFPTWWGVPAVGAWMIRLLNIESVYSISSLKISLQFQIDMFPHALATCFKGQVFVG